MHQRLLTLHKINQTVRYCKLTSDCLPTDQVIETSLVHDTFIGKLKERNKCRICDSQSFSYADFTLLNFANYRKNQKITVQANRQHYNNLMSSTKSKNLFFLKQFEKFYISVFDHLYDFLNRGYDGEENDTFYCENCKMTINCAKRYNFLTLPEVLTLGFDFNPRDTDSEPLLPFKLDLQINLSYLLSEDCDNENGGVFTKCLSTINEDVRHTSYNNNKYSTHIYKLRGAVQLVSNAQNNHFQYIEYINLKDKWYIMENGGQKLLKEAPTIIGTDERPIVMCHYERAKQETSLKRNIHSQITIGNSMTANIQVLSIPDEYVYRLLYLSAPSKPSLDFYICHHKQLKPLFYDIYGCKKHLTNFNKHSEFIYSNKKKFNKELKEYRMIQRTNMIGSPEVKNENLFGKKIEKSKLRQTNTVEFNDVKSRDNIKLDCSFARLHYLANALDLPKPVSEYLLEKFNFSLKGLNDLKWENYAAKCQKCTHEAKRQVVNRILQKALVMEALSNNEPLDVLIDLCWFKNYRLFLLADMSRDNLSKQLYNCNYVNEPFNVNIHDYYTQFKHNYASTKEMMKNEFVAVSPSMFGLLKEIYGCEQIVRVVSNGLDFCEPKECKELGQSKIHTAYDIVVSVLKKLLGVKVLDDRLGSQDNVPSSAKGQTHLIEAKSTEELLISFYDELLAINEKMNTILKVKIKTSYAILDTDSIPLCEIDYKKNLAKIYRLFGTNNVDAINLQPCIMIKELLEDGMKTNTVSELHSVQSKPSIDKQALDSVVKVSNVIKSMDNKTMNELFIDLENKQKKITKTRQYLENLELSISEDKETKKSDGGAKIEPCSLQELYKPLEEINNIMVIDRDALFSHDNSLMGQKYIEKKVETKLSRFKQNFVVESRYLEDKEYIKYINHEETDNQATIRSNDQTNNQQVDDKKEFDYDNFLELEVQNSFSQDLDLSCSDISKSNRLNSLSPVKKLDLRRNVTIIETSEILNRDESKYEDITLNSDSNDNNSENDSDVKNIEIPAYDSNEDFKPHKSPENSIYFEKKMSQLPSKRSHFSRMGSIIVTDNSESDNNSENVSMTSNIFTTQKAKESKHLARRNTKKMLFGSINIIKKENAYTIKANRAGTTRSSFMLIINKTPNASVLSLPINLFEEDVDLLDQPVVVKETKMAPDKFIERHITVIRECTIESCEDSAGDDLSFIYDSYVDKVLNTQLTKD